MLLFIFAILIYLFIHSLSCFFYFFAFFLRILYKSNVVNFIYLCFLFI